jgi:hypothetical protein
MARVIAEATMLDLARRLGDVPGVIGVVLGGSRARGAASANSDVDLGIYYRPPLDVPAVQAIASAFSEKDVEVTVPGGWGPWVDGGGWLTVEDTPVDLIYRDVERVQDACETARVGRYAFHAQIGHPLGVPDFAYAGEIALARILADPTGALDRLRSGITEMPAPLGEALVAGLWEADFLLAGARKAAVRGDVAHVAGSLYRIVGVAVHALHGRARAWLVNEKGAVASAMRLPVTPPDFADRVNLVLGAVGTTSAQLVETLDRAEDLVSDTRRLCGNT